jgi:mycothiol system anti-sigma-R factor
MNCQQFEARLHPYVDGELTPGEMAVTDAHASECWRCADLARREQQFRQLLRRQPAEAAPEELRARIISRIRRERRRAILRPWLVAPAVAVAATIVVALLVPAWRQPSPLVGDLVDKHIAYTQIERPAEFASTDRVEVETWFRQRAGLQVTVPDYSRSGIRLVGARLAEAHERKAAYLLYEKGRTLLSVFMLPTPAEDVALAGARVSYRGHAYVTHERKGYRTVSWTDGHALFGLVSMLDYGALLECADRLRAERAQQTRL